MSRPSDGPSNGRAEQPELTQRYANLNAAPSPAPHSAMSGCGRSSRLAATSPSPVRRSHGPSVRRAAWFHRTPDLEAHPDSPMTEHAARYDGQTVSTRQTALPPLSIGATPRALSQGRFLRFSGVHPLLGNVSKGQVKGKWVVRPKTSKSRLRRTMTSLTDWCREHRHLRLEEQHRQLSIKLKGHCRFNRS